MNQCVHKFDKLKFGTLCNCNNYDYLRKSATRAVVCCVFSLVVGLSAGATPNRPVVLPGSAAPPVPWLIFLRGTLTRASTAADVSPCLEFGFTGQMGLLMFVLAKRFSILSWFEVTRSLARPKSFRLPRPVGFKIVLLSAKIKNIK